jgi:hypothetical protein
MEGNRHAVAQDCPRRGDDELGRRYRCGLVHLDQQSLGGRRLASNSQPRCSGVAHSGLTVRSLHLVLLRQFGQFNPGSEPPPGGSLPLALARESCPQPLS